MQYCSSLLRPLLALIIGLSMVGSAWAEDIAIMNASLNRAKDGDTPGLYLNLDVEFDLSRNIEDTLTRGIPLYFITEFRLERHRWYWVDKSIDDASFMSRLSYSPLTRQYRLSRGGLSQSFDNLKDALSVLKAVHNWQVSDRTHLNEPSSYEAEARMRLDVEQLPLPMMVGIGDADWNLDSGWQAVSIEHRAIAPDNKE